MTEIFNFINELFQVNHLIEAVYKDGIMTLKYENGETELFKGECTVWYKMPLMERCSTPTESRLCEIEEYIEHYGNPYPNAHKKC